MAFALAVGDVVSVRVIFKGPNGQEAINTIHYITLGIGGPPATDADVATFFDAQNAGTMQSALSQDVKYDGVEVSIISLIPQGVIQKAVTGAGFGVVTQIVAAAAQSGIFQWYSIFAGPKYRGRTYWPWPWVTAINSIGFPTSAYITLISAVINAWFSTTAVSVGGRTATMAQVIWHRSTRTFTYITTPNTTGKFATQKRRGNYGKNRNPPL